VSSSGQRNSPPATVHQLNQAIIKGDLAQAKSLVALGVNVNEPEDGRFLPLHVAIGNNQPEMIVFLLEKGANVNAVVGANTALHIAVRQGRQRFLDLLSTHGADVNIQEQVQQTTPLHLALRTRQLDIAKQLVAWGARFDIRDSSGVTAMDLIMKDKKLSEAVQVNASARKYRLSVTVVSSLTRVFSVGTGSLEVTLRGPVTKTQREDNVATGTPTRFDFNGIPEGKYRLTAVYGGKEISRDIAITTDTTVTDIVFK
jgi:ankyrin repeat protein